MPSKRVHKSQKPSPVFNDLDSYLISIGLKTSHIIPFKEKSSFKPEIGQELWVRESWQLYPDNVTDYVNYKHPKNLPIIKKPENYKVIYKSDVSDPAIRKLLHWRSPVILPQWAARYSITITDIHKTSVVTAPLNLIKTMGIQSYPDYLYELEDPDNVSEEDYIIKFFRDKIPTVYNISSEIVVIEFQINQINQLRLVS